MALPIYIFDAGSTKTDLLVYIAGKISNYSLDGYNPNRPDTLFFSELKQLNLDPIAYTYFYGSGLGNEENKNILKSKLNFTNIEVFDDITGAARACFNNKSGIVAILGTGANVAYYNGHEILKRRGGYGYLIDDIGGGLELGKVIVSHWLSGDLNVNSSQKICQFFNQSELDFIPWFYQNKDLSLLSELTRILPELSKHDQTLFKIIKSYFDFFISKHILPISENYNLFSFSIVGSISYHFSSFVSEAAINNGIDIDLILQKPILNLLNYHLTKK